MAEENKPGFFSRLVQESRDWYVYLKYKLFEYDEEEPQSEPEEPVKEPVSEPDDNKTDEDKTIGTDDLIKMALDGNVEAQLNLGCCYYAGDGVEQSFDAAVKWFRKAAEQGDAVAQYNLGECYAEGSGVEQNFEISAEWFLKAAEQGYDNAQNNLGNCYYQGIGVEKNPETAVEWYKKRLNRVCRMPNTISPGVILTAKVLNLIRKRRFII